MGAHGDQQAAARGLSGEPAKALSETYRITGLLHDFDYEKYPSAEEHPFVGNQILAQEGWPEKIREAIEILGVERIGHGIAAIRDEALMEMLAERGIRLEICPGSNLRTGALAGQLGKDAATMEEHPLGEFVRRGVAVTIATDDPAMFHTSLEEEYRNAWEMGLTEGEIGELVENGFRYGFGDVR